MMKMKIKMKAKSKTRMMKNMSAYFLKFKFKSKFLTKKEIKVNRKFRIIFSWFFLVFDELLENG